MSVDTAVVGSLRLALAREAPRLTLRPELIHQQLVNRLQWEPAPISDLLDRELARLPDARRWMRLRTPIPEAGTFRHSMVGHRLPIASVAFNPSGSLIATAGEDARLIVWETHTGQEVTRWDAANQFLMGCCFTADDRVLTVAADNTVRLWATDGTLQASFEAHTGTVVGCDVAPDRRRVVTASDDGTAIVWDLETAEIITTISTKPLPPAACAFAPDGRRIATAGRDGAVRLWDPDTGSNLATIRGHVGPVADCTFGPDGTLVSAGTDGTVRIWEPDGTERAVAAGHEGRALTCVVVGDGHAIVSAGDDRLLRAWDPATGEPLAALHGHSDGVYEVAASPDGSLIVSAGRDLTARLWSTDGLTGTVADRPGHREVITGCATIPGTGTLATTSDDGDLRYWSIDTLEPAGTIGVGTMLRSCSVSADGRHVAAGGGDQAIRVWEISSSTLIGHHHNRRDDQQIRSIRSCALDADGRRVAVRVEGTIRVLDTTTGEELHVLERQRTITSTLSTHIPAETITFLPDGDLLAAHRDGTLVVWDLTLGTFEIIGEHDDPLEGCDTANGLAASTDDEGRVRVWELATETVVFDRKVHRGRTRVCALSRDGALVASGGHDRIVAVHDVATGECVGAVPTEGWVTALTFDDTGRVLLVGDEGGSLYAAELLGVTPGA